MVRQRNKRKATRVLAAAAVFLGTLLGGALHFAPVCAEPAATASEANPSAVIDRMIERRWKEQGVTPAAPAEDRAFVRRVYLDLAGRIPTPEEAEQFTADPTPGKRAALVDRLLASPDYARRMRDVFDVVLMGRAQDQRPRHRGGSAGGDFRREWLAYLERSFGENRPWDRTLRDILVARPESEKERGAVWFLFARGDKYQEIAEAVSPAVFGVQVACAQCHNHPLAHEVKQAHYWGLVAFFNRGKPKVTKTGPQVAESAIGGFAQFATLTGESYPAELSFLGAEPVPEARPAEGQKEEDRPELYLAAADAETPPVPKFSRREQFVERVVRGNPLVARAAVNRFWALLMGRGLVHPVDRMDSKHPPSHPELLDWLAQDFERSGFDVKRLVRALVLSRPYALESRPVGNAPPESFAFGLEKPLTAEDLHRSLMVAATGRAYAENPALRAALVRVFPDVLPEESIANLRQTMFLTNNPMVQELTKPAPGNTVERLARIEDPAARVREAYRIAYGREPAAEELNETVSYVERRKDRSESAIAQLWWALLAGAEFRFNH